jgi:hypothetical protein
MSRKARMWAAAASAVALAIGLSFATGVIPGAWASFQAETQNTNSAFAGDWVGAPTNLNTPTVVNALGATLTWVAGTHNISNQDIWYADTTTTTTCSTGLTYASLTTGIGATATTISGSGAANDAVPSGDNGDNICYQVRSTNTSGWYTVANFPAAIQVGLVPTSLSYTGSASHQITNGTQISIGYNQAISYSGTATVQLCITPSSVVIGSSGSCTASVGTLAGSANKTLTCPTSGVAASGSTLTVTVGGCPTTGSSKAPATMSGTATYTATGTAVTSSTGGIAQCTKSNCKPTLAY